jgi:hypothetical protein
MHDEICIGAGGRASKPQAAGHHASVHQQRAAQPRHSRAVMKMERRALWKVNMRGG